MVQDIFDIIETALEESGYTIMDGDGDSVLIRNKAENKDYEIKISELD